MNQRIATVLLLGVVLFPGCHRGLEEGAPVIRIQGSDTMLILANNWAEAYMKSHPGVSIYVEGGGSGTGMEALLRGNVNVAMTSRLIRTTEVRQMAERYHSIGISFLVAKDALSIYLNKTNPVMNLTLRQLKDLFSGKIVNWKDAGGEDLPVLPAIRPPASGTYLYFRQHVMEDAAFADNAVTFQTTHALIRYVEEHPNAITFGGIGYGPDVKHCSIDGIAPTEENVLSDRYPLARYLYLYTVDKPPRYISAFIDWVMSGAGQYIVRETGYIPIWPTAK